MESRVIGYENGIPLEKGGEGGKEQVLNSPPPRIFLLGLDLSCPSLSLHITIA